ncbi:P-loop containing nucleoside triphosphate hydrolase protein [Chytriomyces cf. hyalinus JEL632]|nr:P-loop containing nucleoside triphosphate hydrolase protein [Chytriomyces cf. hyalinus JEL632]
MVVQSAVAAAAAHIYPIFPMQPMDSGNIRMNDADSILSLLPNSLSASTEALSTGCSSIDTLLGGGIHTGLLTEVYGESGAGKTQLALQLCVTCQWPQEKGGLGGGAAYILSEALFPSTRYHQLASTLHWDQSQTSPYAPEHYSDNVHILHVRDAETQMHAIQYHLPVLIRQHGLKLIVIDSVAATLRYGFEDEKAEAAEGDDNNVKQLKMNSTDRSALIVHLARVLKRIASEFNCAVVCLNQVTAQISSTTYGNIAQVIPLATGSRHALEKAFVIDQRSNGSGGSHFSNSNHWGDPPLQPALGLLWSSCVNTRICISKVKSHSREQHHDGVAFVQVQRRIQVIFSATGPSGGEGILCDVTSDRGLLAASA